MSQSGKSARGRLAAALCAFTLVVAAGAVGAGAGGRSATLSVRVVVVAPCDPATAVCDPSGTAASLAAPEPGASRRAVDTAPMRVREETVEGRSYRTVVY